MEIHRQITREELKREDEEKRLKIELIYKLTRTRINNLVAQKLRDEEIVTRVNFLKEIGLNPNHNTAIRLLYTEERLEWLKRSATWLFPRAKSPIAYMNKKFGKSMMIDNSEL